MEGRKGFFLTIGNGGGVELRLNGKSLGIPGQTGKVVRVRVTQSAGLLRVLKKPSQGAEAGPQAVDGVAEDAATSVSDPAGGAAGMEDDGFDR